MEAFAVPIKPGKEEAWKSWAAEISGARKAEFDDMNERMGLTTHAAWLQQNADGSQLAVVVSRRARRARVPRQARRVESWIRLRVPGECRGHPSDGLLGTSTAGAGALPLAATSGRRLLEVGRPRTSFDLRPTRPHAERRCEPSGRRRRTSHSIRVRFRDTVSCGYARTMGTPYRTPSVRRSPRSVHRAQGEPGSRRNRALSIYRIDVQWPPSGITGHSKDFTIPMSTAAPAFSAARTSASSSKTPLLPA